MASTSPVRLSARHRALLDRLQARLARALGRKPSKQDVLDQAVAFAWDHQADFIRGLEPDAHPKASAAKWLAAAEDLGDWTTADIDDIVYGGRS